MNQDEQKRAVARAAIQYVPVGGVIGVGTGTTANYFIDELAAVKRPGGPWMDVVERLVR